MSRQSMISSFIEDAPPGELNDVVNDIKTLTSDPLSSQTPAFKTYNESQFTSTQLPSSTHPLLITPHNALSTTRYYDTATSQSFSFDHLTRTASNPSAHQLESAHTDLIAALLPAVQKHAAEHFPSSACGVFPTTGDGKVAVVIVANRYSPQNFWNGRWRSEYVVEPGSGEVKGSIKVDVHYYEDGNVRLLTEKPVNASVSSSGGSGGSGAVEVVRAIAQAEKRYQEDLNRAFGNLSEGVFKSLRRQLPVTRQKIEWEKIGGYRLGQDIGGGRSR